MSTQTVEQRKKTIAVVTLLWRTIESSTMAAAVAPSPLSPFSRHVLYMSALLMVTQLQVLTSRQCALVVIAILYRIYSPGFVCSFCKFVESK